MLYLIRHGQTEMNQAHCLQGRSDHSLNETGLSQARDAGAFFRARGIRFDRVYSSPLRRAVQTARLAAGEDMPLVVDERLIEMDYGPYEGMPLTNPAPEVLHFFQDFAHHSAPEGMEPLADVVGRLGAFLEELRAQGDGEILVSTHAIALKGALEYLDPSSHGSWWSRTIGNCAVFCAAPSDSGYGVPELLYNA